MLVDVTDLLQARWRAGIQRVVCHLVELLDADDRVELVPVVWLESTRSFRLLTPAEHASLQAPGQPPESSRAPGAPATSAAPAATGAATAPRRPQLARAVRSLRAGAVGLLAALRLEQPLRAARRWGWRHGRDRQLTSLVLTPPSGSVLLELDTVWNNAHVDRRELYRDLRARGVGIAALVYDLLPQTNPDWFEPTMVEVSDRTIEAQAGADLVLAISEHTATTLRDWARGLGVGDVEPVVIRLGADLTHGASTPEHAPARSAGDQHDGTGAVMLMVGTVEPRKNHRLALQLFDRLASRHPDLRLVVIGRAGWRNDEVVDQLLGHPELGHRLLWLQSCDDVALEDWYRRATLVLVPSLTEGYGLPVIEALAHGVPVIASSGGALPEAGSGLVEHLDPTDVDAWVAAVERYLGDGGLLQRRREQVRSFEPVTWAETGEQVVAALLDRFRAGDR